MGCLLFSPKTNFTLITAILKPVQNWSCFNKFYLSAPSMNFDLHHKGFDPSIKTQIFRVTVWGPTLTVHWGTCLRKVEMVMKSFYFAFQRLCLKFYRSKFPVEIFLLKFFCSIRVLKIVLLNLCCSNFIAQIVLLK